MTRGKKLYVENLFPMSYYPNKFRVECLGIEPGFRCDTLAAKFMTHSTTSEFADVQFLKKQGRNCALLNWKSLLRTNNSYYHNMENWRPGLWKPWFNWSYIPTFLPRRTSRWCAKASSLLRLHFHTQTHHTRLVSSRRVINPTQRPLPENIQHPQQTNIYDPGGILNHNASKQAAADPRLRPRDHWEESMHAYNHTNLISKYSGLGHVLISFSKNELNETICAILGFTQRIMVIFHRSFGTNRSHFLTLE
jgi:hypothetical protein